MAASPMIAGVLAHDGVPIRNPADIVFPMILAFAGVMTGLVIK